MGEPFPLNFDAACKSGDIVEEILNVSRCRWRSRIGVPRFRRPLTYRFNDRPTMNL